MNLPPSCFQGNDFFYKTYTIRPLIVFSLPRHLKIDHYISKHQLRGRLSKMAAKMEDVMSLVKSTLSKHSSIKEIAFCKDSKYVEVDEIGSQNLNNVFRVKNKNKSSESVIVKHAPPYIKHLGPAFPLSAERGSFEFKAFEAFQTFSLGCVPIPYFYDEDNKVLCIEDLKSHSDYRKCILKGEVDVKAAEAVARHMARIHSETHISKIGEDSMEVLNEKFENTSMVALTKKNVFTAPFSKGNTTNKYSDKVRLHLDAIYKDNVVLETAKELKDMFQKKRECLIHGDLNTGSVLVAEQNAKLISVGFAHVGPASFDLGMLFASYILGYYHHLSRPDESDGRNVAFKILDCCNAVSLVYQETITSFTGESKDAYIKNLLSEATGFAGCELIRRIVGSGQAEETLDFLEVEPEVLGAGIRLLKAYKKIHDVGTMLVTGLMLA